MEQQHLVERGRGKKHTHTHTKYREKKRRRPMYVRIFSHRKKVAPNAKTDGARGFVGAKGRTVSWAAVRHAAVSFGG